MPKKLIAIFVSLSVLLAALPAYASADDLQGRVTSLSLDDPAPYSGILLDSIAASKMIVDQKYLRIKKRISKRLGRKKNGI